ncbi:putative carbonic anhydrase 3 [Drosophila ficusphila]|uniref:putative carbonic anhydrase 3 n=1 Tax=Drosophila ficusphila TaxID=30025 RepID=UPI0007E7E2AC|nr:putative carbonic anhydrase 3 [Drosophila ficusphila]
MSGCLTCGLLRLLWCWLEDLSCRLQDSNLLKLIVAIIVALLVLFNISTGLSLANSCDESSQESLEDGSGDACEDSLEGSSSSLQCTRLGSPETYDYGWIRGPHTWETPCNNQSPINIELNRLEINYFDAPLIWSNYNEVPLGIRLENNGHTLILRAAFPGSPPAIDGGDLLGRFDFREITFRWSWSNSSGSEHTIDHRHSPLEMQCLHIDTDRSGCTSSQRILMISYMFNYTDDNPFLDVLVQHLVAVQLAGQVVEVPPFPLSYLMPAFYDKFYSYHGSLTEPPCHRGAEWLMHPVPLAISERQLNEFRQLRDRQGARIGRNARPVQPLEDRTVFLNRFRTGD